MSKLRVAVRIDDVCPYNDRARVMRVVDAVEEHGATGLLGVVPDCHDPDLMVAEEASDFWEWLRGLRDRGWVVAQHGCTHVYNNRARGLVTGVKNTEFAGNPYEVQLEALERGRDIMAAHGVGTDVFFAPAHSYDLTTLRALRAAGFRYVSDGRTRHVYEREGIIHVPARDYGIPRRPSGIVTLVTHPCESKPLGPWLDAIDRWGGGGTSSAGRSSRGILHGRAGSPQLGSGPSCSGRTPSSHRCAR